MKRKTLLLKACAWSFFLCSVAVSAQQQDVLLPLKQTEHVHDENCVHDSDSCTCGLEPGQIGWFDPPPEVTIRRLSRPEHRDTLGRASNIGGTFGAGESSVIATQLLIWPTTGTPLSGAPNSSIFIGSQYSKNAVLGIYDNDGMASGALWGIRLYGHEAGIPPTSSPWPWGTPNQQSGYDATGATSGYTYWEISGVTITKDNALPAGSNYLSYSSPGTYVSGVSGTDISGIAVLGKNGPAYDLRTYNYCGAVLRPYYDAVLSAYIVPVWNHVSMNNNANWLNELQNQKSFLFNVYTPDTLYTTTRNDAGKKDNDLDLQHVITGSFISSSPIPYSNYTDKLETVDYIRPTTILLSNTNTLEEIRIGDVQWYAAFYASTFIETRIVGPFPAYNPGSCGHLSGWAAYKRDEYDFDTIQVAPYQGIYGSGRYVDAAIRILDEAEVCVVGDVLDNTTKTVNSSSPLYSSSGPYSFNSKNDTLTDALLVLPGMPNIDGVRSNFSLKIGGNAYMRHLQDTNYYPVINNPLEEEFFYRNVNSAPGVASPGSAFPSLATHQAPSEDIWLSGGLKVKTFTEVEGVSWDYEHPREVGTLTDNTSIDPTKWIPYSETDASVYGVFGNYNGQARIHTRSIAGNDTTNIIEIGPFTANQDSFKIYSLGMLKNFRSECMDEDDLDSMAIGTSRVDINNADILTSFSAPGFKFTNDNPLYIIHDGNGDADDFDYKYGITFAPVGVDSVNYGINNAIAGGTGDLHIQAQSYLRFIGSLDFNLVNDNEIKLLSDQHSIYVQDDLNFDNANTAHLTVWARGKADPLRGSSDIYVPETGAVKIGGSVTANLNNAATGPGDGLVFFRSDLDDVLIGSDFTFLNHFITPQSGELIVQAGQDILIGGDTKLTQDGERSMLFEAQKTVAFMGTFDATLATAGNNHLGDLVVKAGYPFFFKNTDFDTAPTLFGDWGLGACAADNYENRSPETNPPPAYNTGGDIWYADDASITFTPSQSGNADAYLRAFNSIYLDGDFILTLASAAPNPTPSVSRDTILLFAETGNVEAVNSQGTDVEFNISNNDWVYFLYQAGNKLGNYCGVTECFQNNQWDGNILFGNNKTFTINHNGLGTTLISAARDIENQIGADVTFNYTNSLGSADYMMVTAGRHIETHAPYLFNYPTIGISNPITMQAGHQAGGCSFYLCKTTEQPSSITYNGPGLDNAFSFGGLGQGSILAYSTIDFDYSGSGAITMTAKNGNIETDPYLHGGTYESHAAQLMFDHKGTGLTVMEAIDIKLHDRMAYLANSSSQAGYGNLQIHAFDSILTRTLEYRNQNGDGSISITTDKYKPGTNCGEYLTADGGLGINQGHIVLGYGADCANGMNVNDSIIFDFSGNPTTRGANVLIRAGYLGYQQNPQANGYGGNITFDFIYAHMADGDRTDGGYMEISTPNGNIWGKDSLYLVSKNGDLVVDAGLGSVEDTLRATRWSGFSLANGNGSEQTLNTRVPDICAPPGEWRTGNIMMKGGYLNFQDGTGNATFRTREGYIDTYDAFTVEGMEGHLLKYAALNSGISVNQYGDVSERDFQYTTTANSGSVFFGADDNIMLNYGNNNLLESAYNGRGAYNVNRLTRTPNPFYWTSYKPTIEACGSVFDVNTNGYLWYMHNPSSYSPLHTMYRGSNGSPLTGVCATSDNNAREMIFHFDWTQTTPALQVTSGGLATVANNFIDVFTKFEFFGGSGSGLHSVPGMGQLHGENVAGYGLFMKSQFQGDATENRRATCYRCGIPWAFPIEGRGRYETFEWPYIGFHDDARVHTNDMKSLIEAPVVEFFGHAELDAESYHGSNTDLTVKADSLIFHDSVVFNGTGLTLLPYTTGDPRANDMRYGVINDDGPSRKYYGMYGPAISMEDRNTPIIELGYQRCIPPRSRGNSAPNARSGAGLEPTPYVGGDIIVAFKNGFTLPIVNTVVANHARISFITDSLDNIRGGEFVDSYIRTDLLRIRNNVEFYTAPGVEAKNRSGKLELVSYEQMPSVNFPGIYPHHLHMEPGSELSLPGEDGLTVTPTTTLGGYGNIHENIHVVDHGTLAPGFASLMEFDCQTPHNQGTLTMHNLRMEKDAVFRISIGHNIVTYPDGKQAYATLTDKVVVNDTVELFGRIPVIILPESDYFAPGVYTILEYGDLEGLSSDYVRNFFLPETNYFGYFFSLNFSERGKVKLDVGTSPSPPIQRFIQIPKVDGVTTVPAAGTHYAPSDQNFSFRAYFDKDVLAIKAEGYITGNWIDLDQTRMQLTENGFIYGISRVLEPYVIHIGPELTSVPYVIVGNDAIDGAKVWSYKNTLYINATKDDVVTIYSVIGVLLKKENVPAGLYKTTLNTGIYMITLGDGSRYKVIIQ